MRRLREAGRLRHRTAAAGPGRAEGPDHASQRDRRVTKPDTALRLSSGSFPGASPPNTGESFMKLVTAIIKPFKLDDVRESLSEIGCRASR